MRHLIVLVDALGWLTVERLGFMAKRLPFRRRLTTVFGYSSTAIPSLLTGTMPDRHGHWFLYRRAQGRSPFVGARWIDRLPGNLGSRWRVRVRLQEYWRRRAGIEGYFSLYEVPLRVLSQLEPVEIGDTWAPGAFPETPSLVDYLRERDRDSAVRGGSRGAAHISDWRVPDEEKVRRARVAVETEDPDVVLLYLTEVDAVQHRVGSTHPEFDAKVMDTGTAIEDLLSLMGSRGETTLSLFSDHGMTDIVGHHDLLGHLAAKNMIRGRDFECFLDSTVARFWEIRDPGALAAALSEISWGRVLDADTLRDWGVHFPDGAYGDRFFLADPGVLILPSDMGSAPLAAMHGYDPADPTSDACFWPTVMWLWSEITSPPCCLP